MHKCKNVSDIDRLVLLCEVVAGPEEACMALVHKNIVAPARG